MLENHRLPSVRQIYIFLRNLTTFLRLQSHIALNEMHFGGSFIGPLPGTVKPVWIWACLNRRS